MTPKLERVRVSSRGQVIIPARVRRRYGIRKGTEVVFLEEPNRVVMQPITRKFIEGLCGSLKGSAAMDYLLDQRKRDRKL